MKIDIPIMLVVTIVSIGLLKIVADVAVAYLNRHLMFLKNEMESKVASRRDRMNRSNQCDDFRA